MPRSTTKPTNGEGRPPRHERSPTQARELWSVVRDLIGLELVREPVCQGHSSPWQYFAQLYLERPPLALVHGPRGGGKSLLAAVDTHLRSRWTPGHGTRILGGSRAQSAQVYEALASIIRDRDPDAVAKLQKETARYHNGADVTMLAASRTSVRGPHVPSLKLDEVDEIDPEIREAAMGMCLNRKGQPASVLMTSTWHRLGGPMATLIERGRAGQFPFFTFCAFDVLEFCPEQRSGPALEHCPRCPLMPWCHEDRDSHPSGLPKAKRARGHYGIDTLIQKVQATSLRTFEADYLCRGPRADGLWFPGFDESSSVTPGAEYDPTLAVHLAIDPGVFTGAVFFQIARIAGAAGPIDEVRVFADYLAEDVPAERNAAALVALAGSRCQGRLDSVWYDPAGSHRTPIGPTVLAELERGGLRGLRPWPRGSVADGLALVESFVQTADGCAHLLIHPRCQMLRQALNSYRRARRGGQWQDYPEDPQHPHEDLIDALRGGLRALFPEGRRTPTPSLPRIAARRIF